MSELKDERDGKPSASKGEDYEACHGKHQMESGLEDSSSDAAEEGNRIHLWLEDDQAIELVDNELALAKEMESQRCTIMGFVFPDWQDNPPATIINEERLWYRGNRYSGKADFVAIDGKKALIVDYKCGRIPVSHARENGQMRWNVALLDCKYDLDYVTVARSSLDVVRQPCTPTTCLTLRRLGARLHPLFVRWRLSIPPLKPVRSSANTAKLRTFAPNLIKNRRLSVRWGMPPHLQPPNWQSC